MRRALVLGSGGMRGAFSGGAVTELTNRLGPDYFNAIFASSVGVCSAAFIPANQPELLELIWRELVSEDQLINYTNPLRGRHILDLEYLQGCVKELDINRIFASSTKLYFTLTDRTIFSPVYYQPRKENLLDVMAASCSIPFLHPPVYIDGTPYIDGGLTDQLPVLEAVNHEYDEIIVITNKQPGFYVTNSYDYFTSVVAASPQKQWAPLLEQYKTYGKKIDEYLSEHPEIKVIRPHKPLQVATFADSNYQHLNESFDMGVEAAKKFLNDYP